MELPRRLVFYGCQRSDFQQSLDSQEEHRVKDPSISSGCSIKSEGKWEKRRKLHQRHKNKAPALNHLLAPNSRMQGIFRLSLSPDSHPAPPNLTFDAFTAPNSAPLPASLSLLFPRSLVSQKAVLETFKVICYDYGKTKTIGE